MAIEWRLKIGTKLTGIAIRNDAKYPTMWRVHWANGRVSDMVNLARAKDAALASVGIGGSDVPYWDRRESQ